MCSLNSYILLLQIITIFLSQPLKSSAYGHRELDEECETRLRLLDDPLNNVRDVLPPGSVVVPGAAVSGQPTNIRTSSGSLGSSSHYFNRNSFYGSGSRYYPVPVPESKRCRSDRGLYCNEYSRRCKCHELSGAIYNFDTNRCELGIDNFCTTKNVSVSGDGTGIDYQHFCPEFSQCMCNTHHYDRRYWTRCNNENGLCKCDWGFRPYDDKRSCWWSGAGLLVAPPIVIVLIPVLNLLCLLKF